MYTIQIRNHKNTKLTSTNVLLLALAMIFVVESTGSKPSEDVLNTTTQQVSVSIHSSSQSSQNSFKGKVKKERVSDSDLNQPHSRRKRLVWITDDGRLALPPGTSLTFTPTIAMPLVRHPPEGFFSNVSISFPLTSE
ncbi:uncharacterized protein LOC118738900 [Rhagoletis pomonella]|uniref:uncharacterized protein LOC118738900 n=1 Tax=Rhagoletis pomonella TaxID=28610 RepID=UPI00177C3CB6|nr:uncharacterized protein LOC118738900 [Rhagoletis pomonella]